eukprot:363291-Chlamydomonas_euryale.AAC.30
MSACCRKVKLPGPVDVTSAQALMRADGKLLVVINDPVQHFITGAPSSNLMPGDRGPLNMLPATH